jgi:non-canonical poly(A) RNA polymerase PAPD5/7
MPERSRDTEPDRYRDSYRPQQQHQRGARGGRGGNRGGRGGAPFKKKIAPPAHDRPILSFDYREKTPELMPGMVTAGFELLNDEDDGEEEGEAPMEHSEDDEPAAPAAPAAPATEPTAPEEPATLVAPESGVGKVATLVVPTANGVVEKKLEVIEGKEFVEADKKRIDVISMIRQAKAKAAAEKETKKDSVAANDDFISLNFDDDKPSRKKPESESEEERDYDDHKKRRRLNDRTRATPDLPEDAPRPFSHKESLHGPYVPKEPEDDGPPGLAPGVGPLSRAGKLAPPPGPSREVHKALGKRRRGRGDSPSDYDSYDESDDEEYNPENLNVAGVGRFDFDGPDIPRSRKRKHDKISSGNNKVDGNITRQWRVKPGIQSAPWMNGAVDHSRSLKMTTWYVLIFPPIMQQSLMGVL